MQWLLNMPQATVLPLVALRLVGMLLTAPVLSHEAFPARLRVLAAIVMALPVAAQMPLVSATPVAPGAYLAAAVLELLTGLAVGYSVRLIFAGLEMAAGYIGQQLGVGLIEALNPTMDEAPGSVGRLMGLLAIVIFFAIGGLRLLIGGLLDTFTAAPVMSLETTGSLLAVVASLLQASVAMALKVASPVLVAMLLATVVIAIVQRNMVSFNILTVGFPVYTMLGLVCLAAALAIAAPLMESAVNGAMKLTTLWLTSLRT